MLFEDYIMSVLGATVSIGCIALAFFILKVIEDDG